MSFFERISKNYDPIRYTPQRIQFTNPNTIKNKIYKIYNIILLHINTNTKTHNSTHYATKSPYILREFLHKFSHNSKETQDKISPNTNHSTY